MGSRNRKRKGIRKPSTKEFAPPKTIQDEGVHLPFFVVGMVTSLLIIMMIWNQLTDSDSTKKAIAALENLSDSGLTDVISDPETFEDMPFEEMLKVAGPEELADMLYGLNKWSRKDPVEKQFQSNQRRVAVARKMLTYNLTRPQEKLAIEGKINGLSAMYGFNLIHDMNEPNVAQSLRSAAEAYLGNSDESIARAARLALLKHDAFERGRRDIDAVGDEVVELLNDFPDDDLVIFTIKQIVSAFNRGGNGGIPLMKRILAGIENRDVPKLASLSQNLSDEILMRELGYQDALANIWVNQTVGQKEIMKYTLTLLDEPKAGFLIFQYVEAVTKFFEQEGQYERVREIYQKMLSSSEQLVDPQVAAHARETAEFGLTRLDLVGQKIELAGLSPEQTPIDTKALEKRVVIVLFWSLENDTSMRALRFVHENSKSFRSKGGRVVAVLTDRQVGKGIYAAMASMPDIRFTISDQNKDGENLIWNQCPSNTVPWAILVDQTGSVVDINVPIKEIVTDAGFLL